MTGLRLGPSEGQGQDLVGHLKFTTWLPWSQPFVWSLVTGLAARRPSLILTHRLNHLERYPTPCPLECLPSRALHREERAAAIAWQLDQLYSPTLLHCHFGSSAMRGWPLRKALQLPWLVTMGGRDVTIEPDLPQYQGAWERVMEHPPLFCCVSEDLAARLRGRVGEGPRIVVVPRGVDVEFWHPSPAPPQTSPPHSPLRLLMAGRLTSKKGHDTAIAACDELDPSSFELHVYGAGPLRAWLHQQATTRPWLHLHPPVDRYELRRLMWLSDMLLHPSRVTRDGDVEGVPNAVLEAMACGLPVVATHHGGLSEVITHGETGWLVEERDATAIAHLLTSPNTRRVGERAAKWVRQHRTLEQQVAHYIQLYQELTT